MASHAVQSARDALQAMMAGDAEQLAEGARALVAARASPKELEETVVALETAAERFDSQGDKFSRSHALLALAELQSACMEPDAALKSCQSIHGLGIASTARQALSLQVSAHVMKDSPKLAADTARQLLKLAQDDHDLEAEARAQHALAGALLLPGDSARGAAEAAEKALGFYRGAAGQRDKEAAALTTLAKARLQEKDVHEGLKSALEALVLWQDVGETRGAVTALELLLQAHAMQGQPMLGLRAVHAELEAARRAGDRRGQIDFLDMLAHQHAVLREPISAMKYAQEASELYRALGDTAGQAWSLHTVAEMQRMHGDMGPATTTALQALAAFRAAGSRHGVERVSSSLSSLYAERGLPEKAPRRGEAMRALKALKEAVERRDVEAAQLAEEKLKAVRNLVTDAEIAGALYPLVQRQETAEFLAGMGWEPGEEEKPRGKESSKKLFGYSHEDFYLANLMNGMNFGPQFRAVHPWRRGTRSSSDDMDVHAISCSYLPHTEQWQEELLFRPGIMDSGWQIGTVLGFPP